ncbi:MAG: MASE1 domain-containing protein, partial [Hyphomicrobiaceae bacterium]
MGSAGADIWSASRYRLALVAFAFVALHLCLDWLGQRYADAAQSITPWNPAAGLGIILVCRFGRRAAPLILPTTLISSLMLRGPAEPTMLAVMEGLLVGMIYSIAAIVLTSDRVGFKSRLNTVKDLILLMLAAVSGSLAVATSYVLILAAYGHVALDNVVAPVLRYWVGDLIGIMIVVPFGLLALDSRLDLKPTGSRLLLLLTTAVLMTVAIAYRDAGGFTYFYFLFLPVIWAALGYGIEGVVPVLALIQAGVFVTVTALKMDFLDITHFQARMIALSATGLIAGVLVSERQRFEAHYRRQQQALAQVALRGGMGEFGAAIAHEVNQPLSAAGTFAGLVVESLTTEELKDPSLIENAHKVVRQIDRASGVVRRLRALVKLARDDQAPVS